MHGKLYKIESNLQITIKNIGACTALAKDLSLVLSIHARQLPTACNSTLGASDVSPLWALHSQVPTQTHVYTCNYK